jgi:integrase
VLLENLTPASGRQDHTTIKTRKANPLKRTKAKQIKGLSSTLTFGISAGFVKLAAGTLSADPAFPGPNIGAETVSDITINEPAGKRRNGTLLTDRLCETRVAKRAKYYDRKCRGLYVSITPAGAATFSCNFTNAAGKPTSGKIGIYHRDMFKVADARAKVSALKAKGGAAICEILCQQKSEANRRGVTVDQVIDERVEWMKTEVLKRDGEMRPRIETWRSVESHLRRFISTRLGKRIASEVTNGDIAQLSDDIVAGEFGKPSTANARHMRRAASAMFTWAAGPSRGYVTASPCIHLDKLDEEYPRDRVLTEGEIGTLWHGLNLNDLPWDRTTRLAIKFALVTMLRSGELLGIHRDELNPNHGTVDIPARRVKKRRVINQPLSDLAVELLTESMGNHDFVFVGRFGDAPLARQAMSGALKGTKHRNGKVKTPGICALLGIAPFTPHDLRRTAATMCGNLGLSESAISQCLDHQTTKGEDGQPLPAITNKVYNLSVVGRVERKRKVLEAWAVELRRIIGEPAEAELPLAA